MGISNPWGSILPMKTPAKSTTLKRCNSVGKPFYVTALPTNAPTLGRYLARVRLWIITLQWKIKKNFQKSYCNYNIWIEIWHVVTVHAVIRVRRGQFTMQLRKVSQRTIFSDIGYVWFLPFSALLLLAYWPVVVAKIAATVATEADVAFIKFMKYIRAIKSSIVKSDIFILFDYLISSKFQNR